MVTRAKGGRAGLIRFVVDPDGTLVPDLDERLPGRGAYVTASRSALDKALAKGMISRALSRGGSASGPIDVPADLIDRIVDGLTQRLVDLVGLARRAGEAACGFETVRGWVRDGKAVVLLSARDGAPDGKRKIVGMARAIAEQLGGEPPMVIDHLTGAQLGHAFGRDHVVHAAIGAGGLAKRITRTACKLSGLTTPASATPQTHGPGARAAEPAPLSRDDRRNA